MTENLAEDLDELARELDRDLVFHSWSAQSQLSSLVVASGRGCRVWDHAGREYLDFSSQLVNVNIGHQHPAVVQAIREQAELITTIAPSTVNLARGHVHFFGPYLYRSEFWATTPEEESERALHHLSLIHI